MKIDRIIIEPKANIRDALKKINDAGKKCLLVCNKGKFLGTLSDGDIRKALLKNVGMEKEIESVFNKNSYSLIDKEYSQSEIKEIFLEKKFDIIPVLDKNSSPVKIIEWSDVFDVKRIHETIDMPVVIMAGGKGTRLKPFTNVLPKPLIPLNERTVIEQIIEGFTNSGVEDFYMTINYKGKILKAFFEELDPSYNLKFVEESTPLGTAGSLSKLQGEIDKTFIVANCDVIIDIDHNDLVDFHKSNGCAITLVASAKEIIIPYGSCEINKDGHLQKISEKPKLDYLINTGLYVLEPSVLDLIPKNTFFHITDLINLVKKDKKVGVFPIDDSAWVDIGQWEEYRNAVKKLN